MARCFGKPRPSDSLSASSCQEQTFGFSGCPRGPTWVSNFILPSAVGVCQESNCAYNLCGFRFIPVHQSDAAGILTPVISFAGFAAAASWESKHKPYIFKK